MPLSLQVTSSYQGSRFDNERVLIQEEKIQVRKKKSVCVCVGGGG